MPFEAPERGLLTSEELFTIFIFSEPAVIRRPEPKLPGFLRGQEKMAGVCHGLPDDYPIRSRTIQIPVPHAQAYRRFPVLDE